MTACDNSLPSSFPRVNLRTVAVIGSSPLNSFQGSSNDGCMAPARHLVPGWSLRSHRFQMAVPVITRGRVRLADGYNLLAITLHRCPLAPAPLATAKFRLSY